MVAQAEEEALYEPKTSLAYIWSSRIAWTTRRDSVLKVQRMVVGLVMLVVLVVLLMVVMIKMGMLVVIGTYLSSRALG